jgi:hypothetical protein
MSFIIGSFFLPLSAHSLDDSSVEGRLNALSQALTKNTESMGKTLEALIKIEMKRDAEPIDDIIQKIAVIRLLFDYEAELLSTPVKDSYRSDFYQKRKVRLGVQGKIVRDFLAEIEKRIASMSDKSILELISNVKHDAMSSLEIYDQVTQMLNGLKQGR